MKALTIWQPWASLIIEGWKPREFRSWAAPSSVVGSRIVIHAAKRPMRAAELRDIMEYVVSRDGVLDGILPAANDLLERAWRREVELPMSAGLGVATLGQPRIIDRDATTGETPRYAWPMIDVEKWSRPVAAKGAQGFWDWRP